MVCAQHFVAVLSLVSLSLGQLFQSAPRIRSNPSLVSKGQYDGTSAVGLWQERGERQVSSVSSKPVASRDRGRWMPKRTLVQRQRTTSPPQLRAGGVELDVHARHRSRSGLVGRAKGNGTILELATSESTFIVPVSIGSPPVSYPLQLDLGSSDLLVASTLCGKNCPTSLGLSVNPYYDVSRQSAGLVEVNGNGTVWTTSFADGTTAGGFIARETVALGNTSIPGQVFGVINSTNLTFSDQQISGIIGLGFPRLSVLAHDLLMVDSPSNSSAFPLSTASVSDASVTSTASASSTSSAYLPPLLESLFADSDLPYPVFGLAFTSPLTNNSTSSTTTSSSSSASATETSRFSTKVGSLTLGGISSQYVATDSSSGLTVAEIEWWEVVPFGEYKSGSNESTSHSIAGTATAEHPASATNTSSASPTAAPAKRSEASIYLTSNVPQNTTDLGAEEYLYWAIDLKNVSLNGTDVGLSPTYASIGVGSVALLDAGTNGMYGPQQGVEKIFAQITDARQIEAGRWVVPCDTNMTLAFSFGGRYVQLQPSDWIYAGISQSTFCLAWPVAVPATGDGIDWQLGTPFLRNVYTIFSYGISGIQAPLIGFLPLGNPTSPSSNSSSFLVSAEAPANSASTNTTAATSSIMPYGPTPTSIAPLSLTVTVDTTLPNELLPDPTYSTPSYVYSTSPTLLPLGVLQYEGLANASAYSVAQVPVVTSSAAGSNASSTQTSSTVSGGVASDSSKTSSAVRATTPLHLLPAWSCAISLAVLGTGFRNVHV